MKRIKMAALLGAATLLALAGCKTLPTADKMRSVASAVGTAAGLVATETKLDDNARNTIVAIMNEVARVVPTSGQSFEDAWTPIAKGIVEKFIADGKITPEIGSVSLSVFKIAVKGIDYLFTVRYPKALQYEELVAAAISGFTEGFLTVFKPVNGEDAKGIELKVDKEAYVWLKGHSKK